MSNTAISNLVAGTSVTDTALFPEVVTPGVGPVKVTGLQLKQYIGNALTLTNAIINNPLTINGVAYTFPAANGPAGTVLTNSGAGGLTWQPIAAVTSIGFDASTLGFTVANSPVTGGAGTIVLSGGKLGIAYGGTGANSPTGALINLLPATSPTTAGYALCNDGSGNFYWAATGGGGGGGGAVSSVNTTVNGLSVNASTGNVVLSGVVGIAGGGTGQTTAIAARNALLPAQASQGGKVLGTDGTNVSWVAVTGTGTVTSVSGSGGTTGMTLSGGPITGVGTLTMGGTLAIAHGGTGLTALGAGVQTALGLGVNTNGGLLLAGAGGVLPIAQGGTGQSTASAAITALLPTQSGGTAGQVLTSNGTLATWQSLSGVSVSSWSGGATGLTPSGAGTGAVTLGGILLPANGGTGIDASAATNGQILIGNGSGFTLNTLTAGSGVTITNAAGAITINATGTAGVATFSAGTTGLSPSSPTPGAVVLSGTLNTANGGTGLTTTPLNGQLLIGNGSGYTVANLTAGSGIGIANSAGGIVITATGTAGVSTFSGGSTGLTPAIAQAGPIVLGGVLNVGFGGTGLNAVGAAGTALISSGGVLAYGNPNAATNLLNGTLGQVPYQTGANSTAFSGPGAVGTYLAGNGVAAPTWNAAQTTLGTTVLTLGGTQTALAGMTNITMAGAPYIPVGDNDVATKGWVTTNFSAVNRISPVVAATTGPITLSGAQTIDTVSVVNGDRVLVKDQASSAADGVYIVGTPWTRSTDLDQPAEFTSATVFVTGGSVNKNTSWIQTDTVTTVGVDPQQWDQQSGIFNYSAGTGISLAGTVINNTGVLSFAGGTTGLTPATTSTGAVILAGTLNIANGGTSAVTAQGARTNLLPSQAGNNGKVLQTNGTDVSWGTPAGGATYYIDVSSGGSVQGKITGAGYTDAVANSYVFYNSTGSNITLTATSFPNYASFTDCTNTNLVIYAGHTIMVTTTNITSAGTYAIDASNYNPGQVYNATINSNATLAAIIAAIPTVDNELNVYAIHNTALTNVSVNCGVVNNPGALPGFATNSTITIPASGVALLQTTLASTNYDLLSITNSVTTNISGGAANKIVYQTSANTTDFLPTGTAGQYLKSNGSGAAPSWSPASAAFYVPFSSDSTVSALLAAASPAIVESAGSVVVFYNSDTAAHTITVTNWLNYASYPNAATSTVLTLEPKQTATIEVNVVGSDYAIAAVSSLSTNVAVSTSVGGTISAVLSGASALESEGLIATITNTDVAPITLTAATFNSYQGYQQTASSSAVKLGSGQSITFIVTTIGSVYQILNITSPATTFISTAANYTTASAITNGFVTGNLLSITNTANTSITVTATNFENAASYPSNSTNTVFTVGANATVTLALAGLINDNWQILSYSSNNLTATTSATASGTIASVIAAGSIVEQIGMLITIRNAQSAGATINLTGTLTNYQTWQPASSATGVLVAGNECLVVRVVTPGSAYDVINVTSQNIAISFNGNANLATNAITPYGIQNGQVVSIYNIGSSTITLTATSFDNYQTYPVSSTATVFTLPVNGTVTLELASATTSTWRILSFDYPGLQAGAVAFRATDSAQTFGSTATQLIYTTATINPQNYYDTTTGKFQPKIAGYYSVYSNITTSNNGQVSLYIYKNGVVYSQFQEAAGTSFGGGTVSALVYLNGTTDYVTVYAATYLTTLGILSCDFGGSLVTQQNIINTQSGTYNIPISANNTVSALITSASITDVVNNLYVITNTASTNVTLTTSNYIGYQAYPANATVSTIVMPPGTTTTLQTVTIGTGYQIVTLNVPVNSGSVMFSAYGPNTPTNIGTNSAYPACKLIMPNIYGSPATGNPQNYYDTTSGRFTPKTAGYYQVNAYLYNDGSFEYQWLFLFKNGNQIQNQAVNNVAGFGSGIQLAVLVYMNGSTDYLEIGSYYGPNSATTPVAPTFNNGQRFSAFLTNQTLTQVVGTTAAASVAKNNATQAIPNNTLTKITFPAPSATDDPQGWWNAATNRFIPTIAGYYNVENMTTYAASPANGDYETQILKNGVAIANAIIPANTFVQYMTGNCNRVVYMNGSTDYLESWTYQATGASTNLDGAGVRNNFSISLVGANQAVQAVTQTTSAYGIGSYNSGNNAARYAVAQLDNIIIYQQYQAGFGFATVSGSTQLQGSVYQVPYSGGAGAGNMSNNVSSGPWTITTAGSYAYSSNQMSTWVFTFRDLTANISYRATFILQHGYVNSQCFLERIGGQQL